MSKWEARVIEKYADEIIAENPKIDFLEFKALIDAKAEQLKGIAA